MSCLWQKITEFNLSPLFCVQRCQPNPLPEKLTDRFNSPGRSTWHPQVGPDLHRSRPEGRGQSILFWCCLQITHPQGSIRALSDILQALLEIPEYLVPSWAQMECGMSLSKRVFWWDPRSKIWDLANSFESCRGWALERQLQRWMSKQSFMNCFPPPHTWATQLV